MCFLIIRDHSFYSSHSCTRQVVISQGLRFCQRTWVSWCVMFIARRLSNFLFTYTLRDFFWFQQIMARELAKLLVDNMGQISWSDNIENYGPDFLSYINRDSSYFSQIYFTISKDLSTLSWPFPEKRVGTLRRIQVGVFRKSKSGICYFDSPKRWNWSALQCRRINTKSLLRYWLPIRKL